MHPEPNPRSELNGNPSKEEAETLSVDHGKWTHSHEEDHQGLMVFRPESFSFPRSRGRLSFILEGDGLGTYLPIGADDTHGTMPVQWSIENASTTTPVSFLRIQRGTRTVLYARIIKANPVELVLQLLQAHELQS